ncbi:RNA polymerase-binding protein DksA [Ramlibacter sp. 2FC]|uniref:RNA polymerase-binding protein DksA n=1 Tax=Ramlibacter sp. 2FC TaxID=2502188 RepID=UPI0014852E11|nr:RNA polymerase-binding protein DksA [Ramlibacter sp. 2FC]
MVTALSGKTRPRAQAKKAEAPAPKATRAVARPGASRAAPKPAPKKPAPKAVKPASAAKGAPAKPTGTAKPRAAVAEAAPAARSPVASPVPATPARASRASARPAPLTAPSMAPAVASTAAKASYLNTMSTPVLTPPPLASIKKDPKLANNWKTKALEALSDAEVLAMPDSEYMNDTQMAFFRRKLSQLKQDILANAGETTEHLREDTVIVPDPADRATIEEEHALELRTRDRERKLLKKIEQSIARIDAGDYGYCDETGEPIGVGRLLARPTATLSLEAQQRRELKQKMFGD